jgi:hypothetical protein
MVSNRSKAAKVSKSVTFTPSKSHAWPTLRGRLLEFHVLSNSRHKYGAHRDLRCAPNARRAEGGEEGAYPQWYVTDEQRSNRGCRGGRMPPYYGGGYLAVLQGPFLNTDWDIGYVARRRDDHVQLVDRIADWG